MVEGVPVQKVVQLKKQGADNNRIIEALRKENYNFQQIRDAIQQAEIKKNVSGEKGGGSGTPPAPTGQQSGPAPAGQAPTPPQQQQSTQSSGGPAPAPTPPQQQQSTGPAPAPTGQAPTPPQGRQQIGGASVDLDEIQRVMEEIIEEKWQESEEKVDNLTEWKGKVNTKIKEFDTRFKEVNDRIDALNTVLGKKAEDFDNTMQSVDTEIKALEKSLNKLVPTLSDNISELKDLVSNIDTEKK